MDNIAEEILSRPGHIFPSDKGFGEILKQLEQEDSLCNDTTIKNWKDAALEDIYDSMEGNHIGINSEFFE